MAVVCVELFLTFPFSPFAAVSLCGVAGLAQTFPSLTVSGPFLLDAPDFHVPPDRILPSQLRSSYRALPLHLHFNNCSGVLGFVSSFDVAKQLQPSPSHNRRYLCQFRFLQDCPHSSGVPTGSPPIAHRSILIAASVESLSGISGSSISLGLSCRIANHSTQFSPFRPCLCYSVLHVFTGSSSPVYRWPKIFEGLDCWQVDNFGLRVSLHSDRICLLCCLRY